jgi:hypothetical protein
MVYSRLVAIVVTYIAVIAIPAELPAQEYSFAKLADSRDYEWFSLTDLNNQGTVTFDAKTLQGPTAVFKAETTGITKVAGYGDVINGQTVFSAFYSRLNDDGRVVFAVQSNRLVGGLEGLYSKLGDEVTTHVQKNLGSLLSTYATEINDRGVVAYVDVQSGIVVLDGSNEIDRINYNSLNGLMMNEQGVVAFIEFTASAFLPQVLRRHENGTTTELLHRGFDTPYQDFFSLSLTEDGTIGMSVPLSNGSQLLAFEGDEMKILVDSETSEFGLLGGMSMNDAHEVAFTGYLDDGTEGLFILDGSSVSTVLSQGDQLFGKEVQSLREFNPYFNNRRQIAFLATFTDGTKAIALATPVPEPATIVLIGVAIICLIGRNVWRRNH